VRYTRGMSEHSPGPWTAVPGAYREVLDANGNTIVGSCGCSGIESSMDLAIITAAPEMLALLREASKEYWAADLGDCIPQTLVERIDTLLARVLGPGPA
jgi:hypothetical protein